MSIYKSWKTKFQKAYTFRLKSYKKTVNVLSILLVLINFTFFKKKQAILKMMTEIDEEEDWATSDEVAEDDSDSNAVVAESALDRMACGLGGKTMFPHILTATPQMLQQVN